MKIFIASDNNEILAECLRNMNFTFLELVDKKYLSRDKQD